MEINRAIGAAEIGPRNIGALQVIPANPATKVKPLYGLSLSGQG
jgi:hypothetical protein